MMALGSIIMISMYVGSQVRTAKKMQDKMNEGVGSSSASSSNVITSKQTYLGESKIGGPWTLYDTNGKEFHHTDLAGKYYLLYFGFTYCPDVCPVSLMKMRNALRAVRESKEYKYFDLEAVFVSVDPNRDTNERIEEYCKIFDETLIGLTHKSNNNPQLK